MAIAHKILKIVYQILSTTDDYKDLGDAYLDQLDQKRVAANLVRRLERLGYKVALTEAASTADVRTVAEAASTMEEVPTA